MNEMQNKPALTQGQEVYGQDGERYQFEHADGEWAWVRPMLLIQTTNYRGDDFEEVEEYADHLIRRRLTSLSSKPWIQAIEAESARLLKERKDELAKLQAQIGAARIAIAQSQKDVDEAKLKNKQEADSLFRRYRWVQEFRMIERGDAFILDEGGIPTTRDARELTLRKDEKGKWGFVQRFRDEDAAVSIHSVAFNMQNRITALFRVAQEEGMSTQKEINWVKRWPHVERFMSKEAKEKRDRQQQTALENARARADDMAAKAADMLEKIDEGIVP